MRLIKHLLIIAVTVIAVDHFGNMFIKSLFSKTVMGNTFQKINCFLEKDITPQTVILGDSRAALGLNPKYFKTNAFNLGINNMYDHFQLNLLHLLIEQNKAPETIILHINLLNLHNDSDIDKQVKTGMQTLRLYKNKSRFVKNFTDSIDRVDPTNRLFKLYNYNRILPSILWQQFREERENEVSCGDGFYPLPITNRSYIEPIGASSFYQFENIDPGVIQSIIKLCRIHNIQLILFTSPLFNTTLASNADLRKLKDTYFDSNIYINYQLTPIDSLEFIHYWNDKSHLNLRGANLVTQDFLDRLRIEFGIIL